MPIVNKGSLKVGKDVFMNGVELPAEALAKIGKEKTALFFERGILAETPKKPAAKVADKKADKDEEK